MRPHLLLLAFLTFPLVAEDFNAQLKAVVEHIEKSDKLVVHIAFGRHEKPADGERVVKSHGYDFKADASAMTADETATLKKIFSDATSFRKFRKAKGCGGYFPSLSLEWKKGDTSIIAHVCFSCDEVKFYKGDDVLYCDLLEPGCKVASETLKRLNFPVFGVDD